MKLYWTGASPLMRERRINFIINAQFSGLLQPLKTHRPGGAPPGTKKTCRPYLLFYRSLFVYGNYPVDFNK
jgi:hypothetical protein